MRKLPPRISFYSLEIMAKTAYGEARGEGQKGMEAVAHVILNRALKPKRHGQSVASVCLKPWQFSCWNRGDSNRKKLLMLIDMDDEKFRESWLACLTAMTSDDTTKGSDHYLVTGTNASWIEGRMAAITIGNHKFYNDIP